MGLVSRFNTSGVLLAYFFGPKRQQLPSSNELRGLSSKDAVLVRMVSDLALLRGSWPVISHVDSWRRSDWPMPPMVRYEELTGRYFRVTYDENDPSVMIGNEQIDEEEARVLSRDGLMGAGFAEQVLTQMIGRLA